MFATAALRDAAITAPQIGQTSIITTGAAALAGLWVYSGTTVGWTRPWNTSWGEIARTIDTLTQTDLDATEHVITALATTFTALANRKYRITLAGVWRNNNTAPQILTFKVKDGTTLIEQQRTVVAPATTAQVAITFSVETTLTAASHTINVTHQTVHADGIVCVATSSAVTLTVDDIGASGAPS